MVDGYIQETIFSFKLYFLRKLEGLMPTK